MTRPSERSGCRLCEGASDWTFNIVVLAKYEISCYRCRECGSLQTEQPYWLPEAYSGAAASIDPGAARRTLDCYVLADIVARHFKCHTLLDFGGNTGFLCRLLRDRGYSAYTFDRHVTPTYAPQFVGSPSDRYDLVSAFEVMEHFEHPARDLEQIFGSRPKVVLATTELFSGQKADWWYLAPREGQHVFFYGEKAIRLIAERYKYDVLIGKTFLLFSRDALTSMQRARLRLLLQRRVAQVLGAVLLMRRGPGAGRDFDALTS
jgi:hypothetical protein